MKFSESQAARVDVSLHSNPLVRAGELSDTGVAIWIIGKRLATTDYGECVFCDFEYCDDPYGPDGTRPAFSTVFSRTSPAYRQLEAVALDNASDPLECCVIAVGRTFKLGDPQDTATAPHSGANEAPF